MSGAIKTGRGSDQFMLRLPDGLRARIKAYADRHGRSMNAEIVETLVRENSLRDWFAGQALSAFQPSWFSDEQDTRTETARRAYAMADAMLKAREA